MKLKYAELYETCLLQDSFVQNLDRKQVNVLLLPHDLPPAKASAFIWGKGRVVATLI